MPVDGSIHRNTDGTLLKDVDGSVRRDCCCPAGCDAVMMALPCRQEFDENCQPLRDPQWVCSDAICNKEFPISLTEPTVYYDDILGYCFVTDPTTITTIAKAPEGIAPVSELTCVTACNVEPCLESASYPDSCQCLCISTKVDPEVGVDCCFGLEGDGAGGYWDFDYYRVTTIHLTRTPYYPNPTTGNCVDEECLTGVDNCLCFMVETRSTGTPTNHTVCGSNTTCGKQKDLETRQFIEKLTIIGGLGYLCCGADNTGTNTWSAGGTVQLCVPQTVNETDSGETVYFPETDGCTNRVVWNTSDIGDCESRTIVDESFTYNWILTEVETSPGSGKFETFCVCQEIQHYRDEITITYHNPAADQEVLPLCQQCNEQINLES